MAKNANSGRKKSPLTVIVTIVLVILCSYFGIDLYQDENPIQTQPTTQEQTQNVDGTLYLHMIDVGQADSFLFVQGDKTALIDCGTRGSGDDVVKYLKDHGINRLDFVFGTHPHDDHMGGMYDVITNFEIGKIIIPKVKSGDVTANWYLKLMTELSKKDSVTKKNVYNVEYAELGTIYTLGDATLKVVGPIDKEPSDVNNYSTVLKVTFGEMDVLMTGDAEKVVEKDIIASGENIDVELLKSGHHGSDTSSSKEFLDATTPDYALISSGVGNKYKHPIKEIIDDYKARGIIVYRTDEVGSVVVTITSNSMTFDKDPCDYLSGPELEQKLGGK